MGPGLTFVVFSLILIGFGSTGALWIVNKYLDDNDGSLEAMQQFRSRASLEDILRFQFFVQTALFGVMCFCMSIVSLFYYF